MASCGRCDGEGCINCDTSKCPMCGEELEEKTIVNEEEHDRRVCPSCPYGVIVS